MCGYEVLDVLQTHKETSAELFGLTGLGLIQLFARTLKT
jgi:hypothetical protein